MKGRQVQLSHPKDRPQLVPRLIPGIVGLLVGWGIVLPAPAFSQASSPGSTPAAEQTALGVADAGWSLLAELPFSPQGAAAWRDTLFIGQRAAHDDSLASLWSLPLHGDDASGGAVPIPPPGGLSLTEVRPLGVYDGALLVSVSVPLGPAKRQLKLFAYDGRWRPFPGALPCDYSCLAGLFVHDGTLYALGAFRTGSPDTVENLLAWDGEQWLPLGLHLWEGQGCQPLGFAKHGDRLLAWTNREERGLDDQWLYRSTDRFALREWDGAAWKELSCGQGALLSQVLVLEGTVYGAFSRCRKGSGLTAVMELTPEGWRSLGEDFGPGTKVASLGGSSHIWGPGISGLTAHEGRLVVSGDFKHIGGVAAVGLAVWNDGAWHSLGEPSESREHASLLSAGGALWRLQNRWRPDMKPSSRGEILRWEGPLPLQTTAVPYQAPVDPDLLPVVPSRLPAFRNGDFRQWWRGRLVGWEENSDYFMAGPSETPLVTTGSRVVRNRPEGVVLGRTKARPRSNALSQRFRIEPERTYRVRVLAKATWSSAGLPMLSLPMLSLHLGGRHESLAMSQPGLRWYELALPAPERATVGAISICTSYAGDRLEIHRVQFEELAVDHAECFALLDADLRAHCAFRPGGEAAWDSAAARFAPIAAAAVNDVAFRNIVAKALLMLDTPGIWMRFPMMHDVGEVAPVWHYGDRRNFPRESSNDTVLPPGKRILRLPCGFNVVYPERQTVSGPRD